MKHMICVSLALTLWLAARAEGQTCSNTLDNFATTSNVTTITVGTANYPNDNHIASAITHWSDGCPAQTGSAFPSIQFASSCSWYSACVHVDVIFVDAPTQVAGGGCGEFAANQSGASTGGTIFIYRQDAFGTPCIANDIDATGLIAHELGHALGLANSSCTHGIMGPPAPSGQIRPVLSTDCDVVSENWFTPREEQQENCDLQCSQTCTGYPPSCPDEPADPTCTDRCTAACPCSPLILDLNGDGIHTTNVDEDPVWFDFTGDLVLDRAGWTNPRTDEGILYYDRNRNRTIDGAGELFGEMTVTHDGTRAPDGFAALAGYDAPKNGGNGDGVISPSDRVWGRIRLWIDRDHDGIMTVDEDYSLSSEQILQLNLVYKEAAAGESFGRDAAGNYHRLQGSFVQRGKGPGKHVVVRRLHDVYFAVRPTSPALAPQ